MFIFKGRSSPELTRAVTNEDYNERLLVGKMTLGLLKQTGRFFGPLNPDTWS